MKRSLTISSWVLLLVSGFSLATVLEPWFRAWSGERASSANVLTVLLGDSRRLFARHFYVKADAYFHSGYYPSIFDLRSSSDKLHLTANASSDHSQVEEGMEFLGSPKDWLDRFSRHFYPTRHKHLGDELDDDHHGKTDPHHDDAAVGASGEARELLPWLRMSAEMDPQQAASYVVASYWLRTRLGKVNEAEQFLREGLRANPGNAEILFELGRIYRENRQDSGRARNLWELAVQSWRQQEAAKATPDFLLYAQLLGNLAKLEEEQKQYAQAVAYLNALREISPNKDRLQQWIEDLKAKQPR